MKVRLDLRYWTSFDKILGANFVKFQVFRAYLTYRQTNSTKLIRPRSSTWLPKLYGSTDTFSLWEKLDKASKMAIFVPFLISECANALC